MPRQTRNFRLQERTSCDLIGAFDNKVPFKDVAFATEETISLKAVADFDYEFLRVSALAESITGSSLHMILNSARGSTDYHAPPGRAKLRRHGTV